MKERLETLAREVLGDLAHVGIGVDLGNEKSVGLASAVGMSSMRAGQPFRVASISKIVTGQVAAAAFEAVWETDLSEVLGFDLRPDGQTVTLGQMLSHTSGLSDRGGYALDLSDTLQKAMAGAIWTAAPGARFDYCNLGYVVIAAAVEARCARHFAHVARDLGWPFSFNWYGAAADRRNDALPIYRRGPDGFVPQIDDAIGDGEIERGNGTSIALCDIGSAAAWSPLGGLRASLADLIALAARLPAMDRSVLHFPGPPDTSDLWDQYGAGLMILRRPAFYPRTLIGHFANAYGLAGGVWHDAETGLSFTYALNGLPIGDEDDTLRPAERRIFEAVGQIAAR